MEDGSSMPLWGLYDFTVICCGSMEFFMDFPRQSRNISESDTQKRADEGDQKCEEASCR